MRQTVSQAALDGKMRRKNMIMVGFFTELLGSCSSPVLRHPVDIWGMHVSGYLPNFARNESAA